jgi:hypothetical protein
MEALLSHPHYARRQRRFCKILQMSKPVKLRLIERLMSSLWRSEIQNIQDVAEATGSYRGSLLSSETSTPIEAAKEEKNVQRNSGANRWSKELNNRRIGCRKRLIGDWTPG